MRCCATALRNSDWPQYLTTVDAIEAPEFCGLTPDGAHLIVTATSQDLFVVDVASGRVEQLTDGEFYEHSVEWSPNGQELAFLTNRDTDHDEDRADDLTAFDACDKPDLVAALVRIRAVLTGAPS